MTGFFVDIPAMQDIGGQVQALVNELAELWPRVKGQLANYLQDFSGTAHEAYLALDAVVAQLLATSTDDYGGHSNFVNRTPETYHHGDLSAAKMFQL